MDKKTKEGVTASLGGRFTKLNGDYVKTSTNELGNVNFSTDSIPNEKGQLGFKVNTINKAGYYWASA
ncbi:hypothetical protein GLW08_10810 [Pontibacillus yanchengensis]|uniref:Uncharacterized protein n=2 Tax=Pontibacillus yanchengensis TaxID=462910 RepID=A0ACC7VGL2_9BACI|nr:hypothetical protein [Pontibacillus yanchengensis]MYL34357.1 hypothetical protein [Pontibacillus yanchengensis]MYL53825.1 hypothetical protein [Pontibacillus yanchengensis]